MLVAWANATPQEVTRTAYASCIVELFIADGGAEEYGQGKTFVGAGTADSDGRFTVTVSGVTGGAYLTATATDLDGNTSEFSLNIEVTGGPAPTSTPTPTATPTATATPTGGSTPTPTATGTPAIYLPLIRRS